MSALLKIGKGFSLPLEAVTQTFAILAKRGVGKTYTGAVMAEEILGASQQIVIADPIGVWWGLRSSADGKSDGFKIVVFGGEHADVPLEENSGEIIAGATIENGFSAILDLSLLRKGAQVRFMTAFAEALYRLNRKPLHFMVDEADAFCPQRPQADEARLLGAFEDIVRRGRARGIGVTLITQRAAVINKNVLTQIEVLVCLRTIAPQDREAIEAWIEVHGTQKERDEMMSHIASLPIGTAYFWSPGWLDIFKKVEVRARTTFDSSSTPKVGERIIAPKAIASVDLEKLGDQIKSTVERAKSNDPAELKREIARLKKESNQTPIRIPEIKEVSVFTGEDKKLLSEMQVTMMNVWSEIKDTERRFNEAVTLFDRLFKKTTITAPPLRTSPKPIARVVVPAKSRMVSTPSNGSIGKGAREVLKAAAQYENGVTDEQISVLTGYKKTSRTTFKQQLLSSGYLIRSGRGYQATELGMNELGDDYEPLPQGQSLQDHWMRTLSGGELECFKVYVQHYPNEVSLEQLMEATGYLKTSVTTFRQKLSARNLITGKTASENLF